MMSPMALRRTMSRLSNRGVPTARVAGRENESVIFISVFISIAVDAAIRAASCFSRLQPRTRTRTNDLGGRVILRISYDDNSSSAGFNLVALGDALLRV